MINKIVFGPFWFHRSVSVTHPWYIHEISGGLILNPDSNSIESSLPFISSENQTYRVLVKKRSI